MIDRLDPGTEREGEGRDNEKNFFLSDLFDASLAVAASICSQHFGPLIHGMFGPGPYPPWQIHIHMQA
jgi:hypothetical protein